jgi:hypothetical protein
MDQQYWNGKRYDGHRAFQTVEHEHVSCYSPAEGHDTCDIMIVGCVDGRWYVEDNWGGDAKGADRVWNPFDKLTPEPHFFPSREAAKAHAVSVVAHVSGVSVSAVHAI